MPPTHIEALVYPDEIWIKRLPAFGSRRTPDARRVPVTAYVDSEPWRASVDVLGEVLGGIGKGASMHVVVSDHFLRYALVPWSENLVADAERLAFAKLTMAETYGNLTEGWTVTVDQQPAGQASFACAMDRGLLQALQDMAARRGARLRSVRTMLGERITRHRAALKDTVFCFASVEAGRLTFAFHGEQGWVAVRTRRLDNGLADLLPGALRQEAAAANAIEGGTLYLVGEALVELPPIVVAGWKVVRINEPAPAPPAASVGARLVAAE